MNQRKIDIQICRLMGWSYNRGWAFDKGNGGINVTGKLHEVRQQIKTKLCLVCDEPIGDAEWQPVPTLARFGQAIFQHTACATITNKKPVGGNGK